MVGCGDDASPVAPTAVAVEPVGAQAETPPAAAVTVNDLTPNSATMRVYSISLSASSGSSVRVTHVNPSAWAAISATGERLVRLNHNRRSVRCTYTGGWRRFTGRACSDVEWGHGWPNNHDGSLERASVRDLDGLGMDDGPHEQRRHVGPADGDDR